MFSKLNKSFAKCKKDVWIMKEKFLARMSGISFMTAGAGGKKKKAVK